MPQGGRKSVIKYALGMGLKIFVVHTYQDHFIYHTLSREVCGRYYKTFYRRN